jgi:hypothetical protein
LKKSWLDLADRIYQRIIEDNPALGREHCDECGGRSVAHVVAGALSQAWGLGVPPDLVTAVARRESNFNPYVDRVAYSLEISHNGEECIPGSEIGPMQVMPCAFRQVGMDPTRLLHVNFFERVYLATAAGIRYLAWLKSQFPTWCDVLNAYNVGPGAFREGERSPEYVSTIIRWAIEYSELRVGWEYEVGFSLGRGINASSPGGWFCFSWFVVVGFFPGWSGFLAWDCWVLSRPQDRPYYLGTVSGLVTKAPLGRRGPISTFGRGNRVPDLSLDHGSLDKVLIIGQ